MWPGAQTLANSLIALEPFGEPHRDGLRAAAADNAIWTYMPLVMQGDAFDSWFDVAVSGTQKGTFAFFAVREKRTDEIVGSTAYLNPSRHDLRVEIGFTWYAAKVQGTGVNPSAKLLLMTHAFEAAGAVRVEFKCDARNARSRAALAKLGARQEGTLRRHMKVRDDFWRDTVYFSILREEWPAAKAGLETRVNAFV